jgi:flagellar biosynthesis protein FliR
MPDLLVPPVVLAAIGGLVVNLLSLLELQAVPKERRPDFSDFFYWLPFAAWPLLGGLVGYLYYDAANPLGKFVSFQIGLSSPLILKAAASAIPAQAKEKLPPGA